MQLLNLPAFYDKSKTPSEADLDIALGPAMAHWNAFKALLAEAYAPLGEDWAFSGKSHGWALRLSQKKRPVLYMKPLEGFFRVSFALSESAAEAVRIGDLPPDIRDLVAEAPKYSEGFAIRIEARDGSEIPSIAKLVAFRMAG